MSGKLDQSLDDIVMKGASARGNGRTRGRLNGRRAKVITPVVGGVSKNTKAAIKKNPRAAAIPTIPATGTSKIIVSGLPTDVTELQIKEYFGKTIGPVRSVFLVYGPNGTSRGQATILFIKPTSAHEAATKLNGVKVDNRVMKIEVVLGAQQAPIPVIKALGERIVKPNQPKPAGGKAQPKPAGGAVKGGRGAITAKVAGRGRASRSAGRPKKKSAQELDSEMTDYFGANGTTEISAVTVNGSAAPIAGADASMDDQIL